MAQEFLNSHAKIEIHGTDLPHWQQGEVLQFVTYRLGDSIPQDKLRSWETERNRWMRDHPEPLERPLQAEYHRRFTVRFEQWLDAGYGSCILRDPRVRQVVETTLMNDHGIRCEHLAWVVMPNHVHGLFQPKFPLDQLLKSWKGVSARRIGRGSIWQRNYRDTLIRSGRHLENVVRYLRRNPAKLREGEFTLWESDRAKAMGRAHS